MLHLKNLEVEITTETELRFFLRETAADRAKDALRGEDQADGKAAAEPAGYQRARMRYLRTDVPSLATGTMNCAANAAVFVYL